MYIFLVCFYPLLVSFVFQRTHGEAYCFHGSDPNSKTWRRLSEDRESSAGIGSPPAELAAAALRCDEEGEGTSAGFR